MFDGVVGIAVDHGAGGVASHENLIGNEFDRDQRGTSRIPPENGEVVEL